MCLISPCHCSKAQSHLFHVVGILLPNPAQDPVRKWRIQLGHQRVQSVCSRPGQVEMLDHQLSHHPSAPCPFPHLRHGPSATTRINNSGTAGLMDIIKTSQWDGDISEHKISMTFPSRWPQDPSRNLLDGRCEEGSGWGVTFLLIPGQLGRWRTSGWRIKEVQLGLVLLGGSEMAKINLEVPSYTRLMGVMVCGTQPPGWPPIISTSWCWHPCVVPSHTVSGWSGWSIAHGRSDDMLLLRLGLKRQSFKVNLPCSLLDYSGRSHSYIMRTPGQSHGKELRLPAYSHVSDPPWKQIVQPLTSLQVTSVPANSMSTTSWDTLSKNHPAKLILDSGPKETVR